MILTHVHVYVYIQFYAPLLLKIGVLLSLANA